MQVAHRRLALSSPLNGGAGLHQLAEITRLSEFPELNEHAGWSIYLDDTTIVEQVAAHVVESLKDKPQPEQEKLKRAYEWWGIPTNSKKQLVRESRAERLGAVLDGKQGILRGSTKRCLEVMSLGAYIREHVEVDRKVLQIYSGKMVHLFQFRRCLFAGMEVIFTAIAQGPRKCLVTKELVDETLMLEGLLPVAMFNLKAAVDPVVTASDASETGGGLCFASRLTMAGIQEAESLLEGRPLEEEKREVPEEISGEERVLVIDLFAGIGGLGEALKKAGVPWRHLVAVEKDANCRKLLRRAHPGCEFVVDIKKFDKGALKKAIGKVPNITGIVVGGGSPCQGLSTLSSERKHLADERSALFFEAVRVLEMVQKEAAEQGIWAVRFVENVVADYEDIEEMSEALKMEPVMVDARHMSLARRPRLFWLSVTLADEEEIDSIPRRGFVEKVYRSKVLEEPSDFLDEGCSWPAWAENNKLRFPTMTRAIRRKKPPPNPVGLEKADEETRRRWLGDQFRYPPYTYHKDFMILEDGALRPLRAKEREVLMGFPPGHTEKLLKKKPTSEEEKQSSEDLRSAAIGNSFHTNSVAALFDHCFSSMGLKTRKGPTKIVEEYLAKLREKIKEEIEVAGDEAAEDIDEEEAAETEGLEDHETQSVIGAEHCELLEREAQNQQLLDDTVRSDERLSQALVAAYIRRQEYRGSDVRLDLGSLYRPDSFPRGSIQANRWRWHTATAYRFRITEHINCLELRALVQGLEWRCRKACFGDCRALHLTDSQVALAVAVKGRSSSRALNRLLKRYAALQIGSGVYPLLAWVESEDNPADEPSRRYATEG